MPKLNNQIAIKVNHEMTSFIFNCRVCARNQYSIVYFSKALRIIFDDVHTPNPHDLHPLIQLTRNSHTSVYLHKFSPRKWKPSYAGTECIKCGPRNSRVSNIR